jgi:hypothetical protein
MPRDKQAAGTGHDRAIDGSQIKRGRGTKEKQGGEAQLPASHEHRVPTNTVIPQQRQKEKDEKTCTRGCPAPGVSSPNHARKKHRHPAGGLVGRPRKMTTATNIAPGVLPLRGSYPDRERNVCKEIPHEHWKQKPPARKQLIWIWIWISICPSR